MRKMKENPHEHKSVSQHTMEGYLFVQEKREYRHSSVRVRVCVCLLVCLYILQRGDNSATINSVASLICGRRDGSSDHVPLPW